MAKKSVITTTVHVGKRLLAKARLENDGVDQSETSGVICGNERFGAPLAALTLLYAAHLFAPNKAWQSAIERCILVVDPSAVVEVSENRPLKIQPTLSDEMDIPF